MRNRSLWIWLIVVAALVVLALVMSHRGGGLLSGLLPALHGGRH